MKTRDAASLIARLLADRPKADRGDTLRAVLTASAAGLAAIDGDRAAAEFAFRLADALVSLETAP